jgi:hypothetical protein
MQVAVGTILNDLDGNPIDAAGKPATLAGVAITALLATYKGEENLSGEEKLSRFNIAMKIKNATDVACELTVEDVALVKKLIGKAYGPLVVGQAWKALESGL